VIRRLINIPALAALLCLGGAAGAQVTNSSTTIADAFLATGSPNYENGADLTGLNFGGAGTLAVAPASAAKGEFQSVIRFNLANAAAMFDTNYGAGNWTVTGISLQLTSNYGTAGEQPNNPIFNVVSGGQFVIEWLADDSWIEGTGNPGQPTTDGVTYDSLPGLLSGAHEILCTNTYSPPGTNVPVIYNLPLNTNLVAAVQTGGDVNFLFYAADDQIGYLFNSHEYGRGNQPLIEAVAVSKTPQLKILSGYFTNGLFHLTAVGGTNLQYQVQASSDLTTSNWQTLGSVTADSAGMIQYDDINAAWQNRRFYRLSR
jgi:hypothetical protein